MGQIFLWWYKPITIILIPDRDQVGRSIEGYERCKNISAQWIYNVEVCHRGPIALDHVREVIVVRGDEPGRRQYRVFTPLVDAHELVELMAEWFPQHTQHAAAYGFGKV